MTTPTSTERIQYLGEFLRRVAPDEVSGPENVVDTAIRIIETQQLAIAELVMAVQHTVEYVGMNVLQPHPGWSWYDALAKHDPRLLGAMLHPPQVVIDPADQAPIGESR